MVRLEHHVDYLDGLLLHVLWRAAVLDHKVRHGALLLERHLRLDALLGLGQRHVVAVHEARDLNVGLSRHANDLVNVIEKIRVDFEQQRQLQHDEVLAAEEVLEDLLVDCAVDDGMSEAVQDAPLLDVVENHLAELVAVQRLVVVENCVAEVLFDFLPNWLSGLDD